MGKRGRTLILLLLSALFLPPAPSFALTTITNIRHWTAPDHTRVVIDTSEGAAYRVEKSGDKLSLDLPGATLDEEVVSELAINKPGIRRVAIRFLPGDALRVELQLADGAETKVFSLKKVQDKPDRLVIDIWLPDVEKKQSEEREQVKTRIKERIVIIDPGHGGEDPGAIGKGGTREKDVVLAIGMKLRDALNKKKGYHAFLTREGDYYVSFKKRLTVAREYGADLFISVHADAARNRAARGSSVYCLSLGGASSEAAKILARNENLADIVGGSENGTESDESGPIVLNMFQTNTINQSKTFGNCLLTNLQEVSRPKSRRVQEAPFRVLKLPEIPALLLETAYISNLREEKLLKSGAFQTRLAKAMADSITEFLPLVPSASVAAAVPEAASKAAPKVVPKAAPETALEAVPETSPEASAETPADGTVLPSAQPTIKTTDAKTATPKTGEAKTAGPKTAEPKTVEAKAAGTKTDAKKTKTKKAEPKMKAVPRIAEEETPAPGPAVYRVRKGDTLARIAANNNTTLGTLLKLNHMKLKDPLYVGREITLANREKPVTGKKGKTVAGAKAASRASSGKASSAAAVYRVKSGDTLAKVATKHKTTIGVLLKLNRMRLNDPLLVDQKLILPRDASL